MSTERYNKGRKDWVLPKPDNIIAESNIGWDKDNLYFPAVSTCIALVTVTTGNMLLGVHFDKLLGADDVDIILNRLLSKKTPQSSVNNLAVVGNLTYRDTAGTCFTSQPQFQGEQLLLTFAKKLAVKGIVSCYDQGPGADKTYRAQSVGGGGMALYYADSPKKEGSSVTAFDPTKMPWTSQSLTPLRQLY
jgi:hypothetical protein